MSKLIQEEQKAQKIEIIVVGARNRDPVTFSIIEDLIVKLDHAKIKTILCPALESNVTAQKNKQILEKNIPEIDRIIDKDHKQFVVRKESLKLPFIPIENQCKMFAYMQYKYNSAPQEMIDMAIQSAIRNESNKKHLSLLKVVNELKIPYHGIDDLASVPATDAQTEHT